MRIEHIAFMAADPPAVAQWYCRHLGFTVKHTMTVSPFGHFLADSGGKVMVEIYNNPLVQVPDYMAMNSLVLHLAFAVDDVEAHRSRLIAAGAAPDGQVLKNDQGDVVAMVRNPWGFPVQLVHRATPMV